MKHLSQFVPVRIIDGRKVPVNTQGTPCDPHPPTAWMSHDEAAACGFDGVGFVLTANDPYFCVDLDKCLTPENQWSDEAMKVVHSLPGAMVEVSYSGRGLHIWGRYSGMFPVHACKNVALGLELYHEKRFILLGTNETGNPETDLSHTLASLIDQWFEPGVATLNGLDDWTDSPVPEWTGPIDDDELIRKACCEKKSAGQVFGGGASFKDLWECNVDVLATAFDPGDHTRAYDGSSADAALAHRLAFWTGRDCERVLRIMMRSALVRDKWEREDYMQRTILSACNRQQKVYDYVKPEKKVIQVTQGTAEAVSFGSLLTQGELPTLFAGCVYISDIHKAMTPGGFFLKPEQFKVAYGGCRFMLDEQKTTRNAWEAFTESCDFRPAFAHSSCFRPDLPAGQIIEDEGRKLVNTWFPIITERKSGDASPFVNYMVKLLPDENDRNIMMSYMAAVVQFPGKKFQWSPLLQGAEGNGKSLVMSVVAQAVGLRYTHMPNAQDMGSKFNSWLQNKLFIGVEEIYVGDKREMIEALKPLITNTRVEIQGKGQDQFTGDNRANFILCTNHKDAMPVTQDTRRYCVFYTAQQSSEDITRDGMSGDYFPHLYAWLRSGGYAIITDYLHNYKIQEEYNPATKCHRAPKTSSYSEAIVESRGRVEQEIIEAIEQGRPGFCGGWVSSIMLDRLLEEKRAGARIPHNKRKELMHTLGYAYHPALHMGRVSSVVTPDAGKPRLFAKINTIQYNLKDPVQISAMYSAAQIEGDNQVLTAKAATTFGGK